MRLSMTSRVIRTLGLSSQQSSSDVFSQITFLRADFGARIPLVTCA